MIFRIFLVLFSLLVAAFNASSETLTVLQPAADFTITIDDSSKKLSELKGQVIYLDFWASWCKPCRKSFPWMNMIQKKYANQGFKVITVNLDKKTKLMNIFLETFPASFPIIQDPTGKIAKIYQIETMPSSYLINRNGSIVFSHAGFFVKNQQFYEKQIESLLQQK